MSTDWSNLATTSQAGAWTSTDCSLASIMKMLEAVKALPRPEFDYIVCSKSMHDRLRLKPEPPGTPFPRLHLAGIPVRVVRTPAEATFAMWELKRDGFRPLLCLNKEEADLRSADSLSTIQFSRMHDDDPRRD